MAKEVKMTELEKLEIVLNEFRIKYVNSDMITIAEDELKTFISSLCDGKIRVIGRILRELPGHSNRSVVVGKHDNIKDIENILVNLIELERNGVSTIERSYESRSGYTKKSNKFDIVNKSNVEPEFEVINVEVNENVNNEVNNSTSTNTEVKINKIITSNINYNSYIPKINNYFIPFGNNYKLINDIISNKMFFPMYIYGVSGLGKTFQIEQSCAINKRPFFRVQITKDTTNEDLIGSYSLIDGNTVWVDGPVLMAYKSGGVLLLDEVDLNSSLMFLQVVLENKPVYVPQTGALVYPTEGFTVFATGNSKGDGSDSRFVGTTVLNDAFLERFVTIIEQKQPTIANEMKIINRYLEIEHIELSSSILTDFSRWIEILRKSFVEGNTEIYISSRRIQYILKVYKLINNFTKAINIALARYPQEEVDGFMKTWKACHAEAINENN